MVSGHYFVHVWCLYFINMQLPDRMFSIFEKYYMFHAGLRIKERIVMDCFKIAACFALISLQLIYCDYIGAEMVKFYYPDGGLKTEFNFQDGKINGIYKEFHKNNILRTEEFYKNGKLHGESINYYENGTVRVKKTFENGKKTDHALLYYRNGNLKADFEFKNGRVDGIGRLYSEDGQLLAEGGFKDGKRDGVTKIYNKNGILSTAIYKMGRLIKKQPSDNSSTKQLVILP